MNAADLERTLNRVQVQIQNSPFKISALGRLQLSSEMLLLEQSKFPSPCLVETENVSLRPTSIPYLYLLLVIPCLENHHVSPSLKVHGEEIFGFLFH